MKKIHLWLIAGLVGLVSACEQKQEAENQQTTQEIQTAEKDIIVISRAQFEANEMELGTVKTDTFYQKITAQGVLDVPPSHKAVVSSYLPGKVKNVRLIVGDKVRKGQLLVQISNPDYIKLQEDYLQAKEEAAYLKQEYKRQKQLAAEKVVAEKKRQNARRKYQNAVARLQALKEQLRLLHIRPEAVENGNLTATIQLYAPISGYISKLYVTEGSAVEASDKIMEIINNEHTHLELKVFEKDIMKLKKGQKITYQVPGIKEQTYSGYVKLTGREIDPETRSVLVHGHLNEPHPKFIAGMYIEANIHVGEMTGLAVPATAIVKDADKAFVLKLVQKDEQDYELMKVPVHILDEEKELVHIEAGQVQPGDTILTKGGFFLVGTGGKGGGHSH